MRSDPGLLGRVRSKHLPSTLVVEVPSEVQVMLPNTPSLLMMPPVVGFGVWDEVRRWTLMD